MKKLFTIARDLILFGLLLILIKIAMDRKTIQLPKKAAVLSSDLESDQDYSDTLMQEPEPIVFEFPASENDEFPAEQLAAPIVVDYFTTTDQQLTDLLKLTPETSKEAAQLKSMRQRLGQLKQNYQRIVALSADDGAAVIEQGMKKEQIEQHLLRIVELMGRILKIHADMPGELHYTSIEQGLQENGELLNKLPSKND